MDNMNNSNAPQTITTVITGSIPTGKNCKSMIHQHHTRSISVVSHQSAIGQLGSETETYSTPPSIRANLFHMQRPTFLQHGRSMSDSSFYSIASEKGKPPMELPGTFLNHGYITDHGVQTQTITPMHTIYTPAPRIIQTNVVREQYWACGHLTRRERIFLMIIILLAIICLTLFIVVLYLHYTRPDKPLDGLLPWGQAIPS